MAFAAAVIVIALARPDAIAGKTETLRLDLPPELVATAPAGNPLTPQRIELGRRLFFEEQLSRDGALSCASCHMPEKSFTDGRRVSLGVGDAKGRRNAPSLLDRAYESALFWDGRAGSLEEQAMAPLTNPTELANTPEEIVRRLGADSGYRALFREAFGTDVITIERVAKAIAGFERTLVTGEQLEAPSESARRGFSLFQGKNRCHECHRRDLALTGNFKNTGVSWGKLPLDLGRYEVTGREEDKGKFKSPPLARVEFTAPYMHDGSFETLEEVIDFYDKGGGANPYLDPMIKPLDMTKGEKADLLAFLQWTSRTKVSQPDHETPGR